MFEFWIRLPAMMDSRDARTPIFGEASKQPTYDGRSDDDDAETDESESTSDEVEKSRIFPLRILGCMPSALTVFIPGAFQKIQGWAHLVLCIGVITCIILVVETTVSWSYTRACRTYLCLGRILPLVFVACCLMYFLRTIEQYDEDLLKKQRDIHRAKEELAQRYHEMVAELDQKVSQSTETQASLAERGFESKRRDFQRFLHKVTKDFKDSDVIGSASPEDKALLDEFRSFVMQWLKIFSECSIDPLNRPLTIVKEQELENCNTIAEVAGLVGGRLKVTQVRFISRQRDMDKEELSGFRFIWKRLVKKHETSVAAKRKSLTPTRKSGPDVEAGTLNLGEGALQSGTKPETMDHRWLHLCGSRRCCGINTEQADETGFPVEFHLLGSKCILLSREHVQLMVGFVVGLAILFVELRLVESSKIALEFEVGTCLVCILFVLYEFVDIDIVQQLDTQLKDVEEEHNRLEQKRKAMLDFYDKTQQLADVWLHRTVPRLELLKQFSEEVEDLQEPQLTVFLKNMNSKVGCLESSLPALSLWLSEEQMDTGTKKQLGEAMHNLTRAKDVKETLALMPQCSERFAAEGERLQRAALSDDSILAVSS